MQQLGQQKIGVPRFSEKFDAMGIDELELLIKEQQKRLTALKDGIRLEDPTTKLGRDFAQIQKA